VGNTVSPHLPCSVTLPLLSAPPCLQSRRVL